MKFTLGGTEVDLPNAMMLPLKVRREHHQNLQVSETGKVRVFDRGITETFIELLFEEEHDLTFTDIRSFIENTVIFSAKTFTFEPDFDVDVGAGDGVSVTVRFWDDIFTEHQREFHIYTYKITLRVEI